MSIHQIREPARARQQAGRARRTASSLASPEPTLEAPSPNELRARRRQTPRGAAVVERARRAIADVLCGRDRYRLVVVVGPCSIHEPQGALEYARRLARVAKTHESELIVVMRSYFEKPRSRSGWKGLINDPHLDGSCDVLRGLELAREILLAIGELGLPCASEVLDPLVAPYLEDLLSWAAIGARTVESQPHRELASGLAMPVGVKNGLDGRLDAALNAMHAIKQPHRGLALSSQRCGRHPPHDRQSPGAPGLARRPLRSQLPSGRHREGGCRLRVRGSGPPGLGGLLARKLGQGSPAAGPRVSRRAGAGPLGAERDRRIAGGEQPARRQPELETG